MIYARVRYPAQDGPPAWRSTTVRFAGVLPAVGDRLSLGDHPNAAGDLIVSRVEWAPRVGDDPGAAVLIGPTIVLTER